MNQVEEENANEQVNIKVEDRRVRREVQKPKKEDDWDSDPEMDLGL